LIEHFKTLNKGVEELEAQIKVWHRANETSRQLESIPGIGPLTASALVASVGDAKTLKAGSSWLRG
jgi:transposase